MKIDKKLNEDTLGQAAEKELETVYGEQATDKIENMADQLDSTVVPVLNREDYEDIEKALDRALKVALKAQDKGRVSGNNILLVGPGGSGKTARVHQWAEEVGVNLVEVDAKTMDPSDLNGIIGRHVDDDGKMKDSATRLSNNELDELGEPNTVLFLDELNRADVAIRGSLLTLIQNHTVNDNSVKGKKRLLKGMLFTIAAINPPTPGNETDALDNPMRSRFRMIEVDSNPEGLLNFLKKKELNPKDDPEDAGRLAIAEKVLTSPKFSFSSREEEEDSVFNQIPITNSRSFTNLLNDCDGTKEDFLDLWNTYCYPDQKPIIEDILDDYLDINFDEYEEADDKATQVLDNPFAERKKSAFDELHSYLQ